MCLMQLCCALSQLCFFLFQRLLLLCHGLLQPSELCHILSQKALALLCRWVAGAHGVMGVSSSSLDSLALKAHDAFQQLILFCIPFGLGTFKHSGS